LVIRSVTRKASSGNLHVLDKHDQLIAAEAGQGILRAQTTPKALGHTDQQYVAYLVAQGVVYYLEGIQVQEEHGNLASPSAPGAFECVPETVHEELTIEPAL
jgi:hypothetical protein